MKDIRFVIFHAPGPRWQAGKGMFDQEGLQGHLDHYRKLHADGKLALGGPHLDDQGGGMMIPEAGLTKEELTAFAEADPAVASGLLRVQVRPWLVGMKK
ncbi:YciI family protein [Ideonella sp. A 288]|uniref:YciI family protein n=1 Tax=Ideonella sp. A 288 TaxID=1962181 RepID=UPI00130378C4|nr:YciI family protein [Ideonella sp. A 288]